VARASVPARGGGARDRRPAVETPAAGCTRSHLLTRFVSYVPSTWVTKGSSAASNTTSTPYASRKALPDTRLGDHSI
jgi:hypothetical protein